MDSKPQTLIKIQLKKKKKKIQADIMGNSVEVPQNIKNTMTL